MLKTKLFLDDIRNPLDIYPDSDLSEWYIARTADDAINFLKDNRHNITFVSFDHDLGLDKNGYYVACWIEVSVYNRFLKFIDYKIHSSNPPGRMSIKSAMESARRIYQKQENERENERENEQENKQETSLGD